MKRRSWLWMTGLVVCGLVMMLGPAGTAGALPITNLPEEECNTDGRLFCVDVTTFSGITASDPSRPDGTRYTWVEWKVTNTGGSTLTNPRVVVSLKDFCGVNQCDSVTSQFVLPASPNACTLDSAKTTLTCTYANIPATNPDSFSALTRIYFKTANAPATTTKIDVQATVKERGNDQGGGAACAPNDPNCDTHLTHVVNTYEPDQNAAYTFALNGKQFYLETNDKHSAFGFKSDNPTPFQSQFLVDLSGCDAGAPATCFERTLNTSTDPVATTEYNDGPVLFYARLTDLPSGVNANSVVAIHVHDLTSFSVSANRFAPPVGMDARLDTVKIGTTTYFVVNVNTTTNTFQLAATSGGAAASFPNGDYEGIPTRVIGDQNFERSTKGCDFTYSIQITVPSICAKKVQGEQAIETWVWDSHNGRIGYG